MGKTVRQFGYVVHKRLETDSLPSDPIIQIVLDHWIVERNGNAPIISAHLMTAGEIDAWVQALKDDLDAVGGAAKFALTRARVEAKKGPAKKG